MLWHATRAEDVIVNGLLREKAQLWIADKWHERFNLPPDPQDFCLGHTPDQVAAFVVPPLEALMGYLNAVRANTKASLATAHPSDLDKPGPSLSVQGSVAASRYLVRIIYDIISHAAQIAYLRGMYRGFGWWR
jgi:hypothetical protein